MNSFDVGFDKKNKKSEFNLTINQKNHEFALGYYVIYPDPERRELVITPKHKFAELKNRLEELSKKLVMAEREKNGLAKHKGRKTFVSEQESKDAKMLRSIVTHHTVFNVSGPVNTITLPGKYLDMLKIKTDFLTFIQTASNDYIVINPFDAWKYSTDSVFNDQEQEESPQRTMFGRRKAV